MFVGAAFPPQGAGVGGSEPESQCHGLRPFRHHGPRSARWRTVGQHTCTGQPGVIDLATGSPVAKRQDHGEPGDLLHQVLRGAGPELTADHDAYLVAGHIAAINRGRAVVDAAHADGQRLGDALLTLGFAPSSCPAPTQRSMAYQSAPTQRHHARLTSHTQTVLYEPHTWKVASML